MSVKLIPKCEHGFISLDLFFQPFLQIGSFLLQRFTSMRRALSLFLISGGYAPALSVASRAAEGRFCYMKLYSHLVYLLFFPILIYQFLLDIHFFRTEIFAEQSPCHIQHFCRIQIDVDGKQLIGVVLGKS